MLFHKVTDTNVRTRAMIAGSLEDCLFMTETIASLSHKNSILLVAHLVDLRRTARTMGRSSFMAILVSFHSEGKEPCIHSEPRTAASAFPDAYECSWIADEVVQVVGRHKTLPLKASRNSAQAARSRRAALFKRIQ